MEDQGTGLVAGDVEGAEGGRGGGADGGVGFGLDDFDEAVHIGGVEGVAGVFGGFGEGVEEGRLHCGGGVTGEGRCGEGPLSVGAVDIAKDGGGGGRSRGVLALDRVGQSGDGVVDVINRILIRGDHFEETQRGGDIVALAAVGDGRAFGVIHFGNRGLDGVNTGFLIDGLERTLVTGGPGLDLIRGNGLNNGSAAEAAVRAVSHIDARSGKDQHVDRGSALGIVEGFGEGGGRVDVVTGGRAAEAFGELVAGVFIGGDDQGDGRVIGADGFSESRNHAI